MQDNMFNEPNDDRNLESNLINEIENIRSDCQIQSRSLETNLINAIAKIRSDCQVQSQNVAKVVRDIAIQLNENVHDNIDKRVGDAQSQVSQNIGAVVGEVRKVSSRQVEYRRSMDERFDRLDDNLKNIADNTEVMHSLPSKLDKLGAVLEDKGLRLMQEFPSINQDEQTLKELAECGEKILQQLAIAARWYARKLPELNANDERIRQLNVANEQDIEKSREAGIVEGRKQLIKELLHRYGEIHELMEPTEEGALGRLKTLATFLNNQGVEPIRQVNQELEITADDINGYEGKLDNFAELRPGRIVITSPGYAFDTEIIEKATWQFVETVEQNVETVEQNDDKRDDTTEG